LSRLGKGKDPRVRELIGKCYRTCQVLQSWETEIIQIILPTWVVGAEAIVVFALFLAIRCSISLGSLLTFMLVFMGVICFVTLKVIFKFAGKLTDDSRIFENPLYLSLNYGISKTELAFWRPCKPLAFVVGSTINVTRNTFPTVSQDIILVGITNLLVTF